MFDTFNCESGKRESEGGGEMELAGLMWLVFVLSLH
jgi:hypothetical protein